jgi:ribonucleoside-diphosphate reductase alpha subunit
MFVLKRDGNKERVSFDKVLKRIDILSSDLSINSHEIAQKVCTRIYDGVSTDKLDELAAHICSSLIVDNPDYDKLASRVVISNHQKKTKNIFSETVEILYNNDKNQLVSDELYAVVQKYKTELDDTIKYDRDYYFDYFGFKTLEKSYLLGFENNLIERPQDLFMRVSIGIHGYDIEKIIETYNCLSNKYFIHATPTLFNFGTKSQQGSSCFLLNMESDSVDGMSNTLHDCAMISKYAGGIGLHIHNVRANGSMIRGTNGVSSGIIPMLRVFNNTARHINQAGKRNGSFAIYLEPWHADIESFLDMKKNHGNEEERARDLFYAMWISDLFMKRVKDNGKWSLMCPDECPGLSDVYGPAFDELYEKYESEGRFKKQVDAQHIWYKILDSQIETGTPYMLYKDAVNMKTNHQNLGTIKSSNLCCEIMEYTAPDEIAVCNLASLCLPSYIKPVIGTETEKEYDFELLRKTVKIVTRNLNKVIDRNFYPIDKAERSNMKHRPIAIGVQGLADTYILMGFAYESLEAEKLNKQIFETIYYASLEASMELSKDRALDENVESLMNEYEKSALKEFKGAYSSYEGSPVSKGVLQYDMWNKKPSDMWDWAKLKEDIKLYGIRNSLLVAPMPTASTAQIMGFTESFEPITTNIYKRKTIAGEFIIANKYLVRDLIALGLWDKSLKETLIVNNGSIQSIASIPADIKIKYKTVWEIKQKNVINQAADRGAYICQSQSMNLFIENPTYSKLTHMHFYAWTKGLKTGIYYLRTKAKAQIQQFSIDPTKTKANYEDDDKDDKDDTDDTSECLACGA